MAKRSRRNQPREDEPLFESQPDLPPIDLHRHTLAEAEKIVRDRIQTSARSRSGGLVHIITGRGRNSVGDPVLGPGIHRLLAGSLAVHIRRLEPDLDGGGFYVLLR
jgi:DNA-nicking Smr family endonuclease